MKQNINKHIWIEAEEWECDEWDVEDGNTDVKVTFSDRTTWGATFFTYKNIESLRKKNSKSGECMNGTYFQASDMVLIDLVSKERIYELINHLIDNGEFESVFTKYLDVDSEEDHLYPENFFFN